MLLFHEPFIFCFCGNIMNIIEYESKKLVDTITVCNDTENFVAVAMHPNGTIIACADDKKCIRILSFLDHNGNSGWNYVNTLATIPKSITALYWDSSSTRDNDSLYVTDKFGEVFRFSFSSSLLSFIETPLIPILGHIGTITCILVDDNWIYTADREEKIKQSCKKFPFNIQNYFLGHREYISSISFICNQNYIVSVGGDDYMIIWDINTGKSVAKESITNALSIDNVNVSQIITYDPSMIVLLLESYPWIAIWNWNQSKKLLSFSCTLKVDSIPLAITFDKQGNIWILTDSTNLYKSNIDGSSLVSIPNNGKVYHRNVSKWRKSRIDKSNDTDEE